MSKNAEKKVKARKGAIWKDEIIQYLRTNPSGLTITDIANGINTSRVTVTKYIPELLKEEKVFAKEVGVYKLYFSTERNIVPLRNVRYFYNGILAGLKGKLDQKDYKEVGYEVAGYMSSLVRTSHMENLELFRDPTRKSFKDFFEFFKELYPYIDFVNPGDMDIELESISDSEDAATFIFKDVKLLKLSEEFENHFYLWSGAFEVLISKFLKKQVTCEIIDVNTEDYSVKVSVEIH
jgi:predicted transcriptional regulator